MGKYIYIAFNKPYGVLSQFTTDNPSESLAQFGLPAGVYACGRLDKDSEGLLLLTNDGQLIHQLLDPKFEKIKRYWTQVEKIPLEADLKKLGQGVYIGDYKTRPCKVSILSPQPELPPRIPPIRERKSIPTCWLEVQLTEGKNRQVRKMTAAIGYPTLRLIRMAIGKLELGDLLPGEFKYINKNDLI